MAVWIFSVFLGRLSLPHDPCVHFPSIDVFLLSAARSSLLFSFLLWFWKLVLEKRQSVVTLVLSSFFKLLPLVLLVFFFSGFSSAHCVCVLKTKAKLRYVGFLFSSPVSVSFASPVVSSVLYFFFFFSSLSFFFGSVVSLRFPLYCVCCYRLILVRERFTSGVGF